MNGIEPTNISMTQFSDLRVVLRDKRPDDPRKGYIRIEGLHPKCGGRCTIVREWMSSNNSHECSVIKPHGKCDPIACLDSRPICSGMNRPLPVSFLDSMQ